MLVLLLKVKLSLLLCTIVVSPMRGPHHPRGHYHHSPKPNQKITQDTQLLQDIEHIKEDLGNIITDEEAHQMTPEELEFHYFKVHDYDKNTKLDGLEILQAIHHSTHHTDDDEDEEIAKNKHNNINYDGNKQIAKEKQSHKHNAEGDENSLKNQIDGNSGVNDFKTVNNENNINMAADDFRYFVDLIDQVLAEDDLDNDGYLSYIEYVVGRQKDQKRERMKQQQQQRMSRKEN